MFLTSGHIDIRTYHGFVSDAEWPRAIPALGQGKSLYRVIGVYRKISDTKAIARVQAFLRILREQVAGETSLAEKERSYRVLSFNKEDKENPFVIFDDLSTHPFAQLTRKSRKMGQAEKGVTSCIMIFLLVNIAPCPDLYA